MLIARRKRPVTGRGKLTAERKSVIGKIIAITLPLAFSEIFAKGKDRVGVNST